tara:strand:- start:13 stop:720 length:708 start_codon:yes stop_codon:yes gene_type:complete
LIRTVLSQVAARLLHAMSAAVLPLRCACCDAVLEWQEGEWCGPCAFALRRQRGMNLNRFRGRLGPLRTWSWISPGAKGMERQAVHRLKYGGRPQLGHALGQAMAKEAPREWWPKKERWAVVPIPLHRRKQRRRGYNQSALLAEGWCDVMGMDVVTALVRTQHRRSLTRLARRERLHSLTDAYRLNPDCTLNTSDLDGLILFDDVITTGATMEAAWSALRSAWDGPIDLITLMDAA